MAQKWNLQDIRPIENRQRPAHRAPGSVIERPRQILHESPDDTEPVVIENGTKTRRTRYVLGVLLALLLIAGSLILSTVLAETTITIKPKTSNPNVNAQFEAFRERREDALTYEVLTLEETGEKQVKATGEKLVTEQAKGTIEIFKTTAGAERLRKNTRFKSPDGLIFRIQESVVVPGAIERGGELIPGSIRAEVFAELAGEQYNLPAATRFVIPGFEESGLTDLFSAMYALNQEPFSGGFDGPQFIIDDTELSTARQELQISLRNKLLDQIKTERPAGFAIFDGSFAFSYTSLPSVSFGDDLVTIKEQAVLQVPLFKNEEFAGFIAKQTIPTYNNNPVRIDNYDGLLFSYTDPNKNAALIANDQSLSFTIVGRPRIIWEYDEAQLRADIAGKSKTVIPSIQEAYSGAIDSFTISMKPFYRQSFPDDGNEIRIIEVIDQ